MTAALQLHPSPPSDEVVKRFAELFAGYDRAYGTFDPRKHDENGKVVGRAITRRGQPTEDFYRKHLEGSIGLGVVMLRNDDTCLFGAIDYDKYDNKACDHAKLAARIRELDLPLVACRSKSGGAHLYCFLTKPAAAVDLRAFLALCLKQLGLPSTTEIFPKQWVRKAEDDVGSWINLPYFNAADTSRHAVSNDGRALSLAEFLSAAEVGRVDPARFVGLAVPAAQSTSVATRSRSKTPKQQEGVNGFLYSQAGRFRRQGLSKVAATAALHAINQTGTAEDHPNFGGHDPRDFERDGVIEDIVDRVYAKHDNGRTTAEPEDIDDVINELNDRYAVVKVEGKVVVLEEDGDEFSLLSREDFVAWFGNRFVAGPKAFRRIGDAWLAHPDRRTFDRIVFAPNGSPPPGSYNLFRGFRPKPVKGDCSRFLEHIRDNICQQDAELYGWVVAWFANIFQCPARKPGTALVLRGKQGTGKTVVGRHIGYLLRESFTSVASSHRVTGHFNSHLARCLLLQAEEAFWAGDKAAEGVLKDLITNDTQLIEPKYMNPVRVDNHLRLFITSNSEWVVPAGLEERRFCVLDVGEGRMQDHGYFAAMERQLRDEDGYAALLHHLLHEVDCNGVDLRTIPVTAALLDQKLRSLNWEQGWMADVLSGGILPGDADGSGQTPAHLFYESYIAHTGKRGIRHKSTEVVIGTFLKNTFGGRIHRKQLADERRTMVRIFPTLQEARQLFDKALGRQHHEWGEPDEWLPDPKATRGDYLPEAF